MSNGVKSSAKDMLSDAQGVVIQLQKMHAQLKKNEQGCPLTDEDVEHIYAYGYDLWKAKRLEDAREVFELVMMYRASSHRYMDALARCYYDLGQYEKCIALYQMSSIAGGDAIHNLLQIAFCQFRLGNMPQSSFALHVINETHKVDAKAVQPRFLEQARALQELVLQAMAVMNAHGGQMPATRVVDKRTRTQAGLVPSAEAAKNGRSARKTPI